MCLAGTTQLPRNRTPNMDSVGDHSTTSRECLTATVEAPTEDERLATVGTRELKSIKRND